MILYLDTSALIKLYVDETFSETVLSAVKDSKIVSTQVISYVEAHAAFARLQRENKITQTEHEKVKADLINDWESFLQVKCIPSILQQAAKLTELFSLRSYDSIQLASAQYLFKNSQQIVSFGCFDHKLNQAADVLGLNLLIDNAKSSSSI